ncbi:MAG: imidazoleglycerol-phosphate dehydratase HisB [Solobacterium sp.]|nr:imidazoleglycerol-phosphate dehydratase HisB [Solobacterium sp.]
MRSARIERKTKETEILCKVDLDGNGKSDIQTGIGFFNHMMELFAFHSGMDITLICKGDLDVDDHHSIEDCGIALGQCIRAALGDKKGIERYGYFILPMDESQATCALDFSGRPYLVFDCAFHRDTVGTMATEMAEEFFRALSENAGITLHLHCYGRNDHHQMEALFKGTARAMKTAVKVTSDQIVSSKGVLE